MKRYEQEPYGSLNFGQMVEDDDGEYVKFIDAAAEIERLRAKIAALEPDAALGRAVREMWGFVSIRLEEWAAITIPRRTEKIWMVKAQDEKILGYGETPEAALKAAGLWPDNKNQEEK